MVLRLLLFLSITQIQLKGYAFTVVIDPGHGGEDHGATQGSIKESEIALKVALKLAEQCSKDPSLTVILTRPNDSSISLKNRVALNQSYNGNLFISLHANSSIDKRAKGADFYIGNTTSLSSSSSSLSTSASASTSTPLSQTSPTTTSSFQRIKDPNKTVSSILESVRQMVKLYQSQYLAADTFNAWRDFTVTTPRSIKPGPFYVVNKNNTPSILVEFGFITNTKEALELIKDENQTAMAQSLYRAVKKFQNRTKE